MKRSILGLVALAMALVPSTALAARRSDSTNDVGGKLDIARLRYTRPLQEQARLKISTKEQWGCNYLNADAGNNLRWVFDGKDDGDADMIGRFFCVNNHLKFSLRSTSGPKVLDNYDATRPNKRSAKVQITLMYSQLDGDKLGLKAKSKDVSTCGLEGCKDRAPNRGWWTVDR